MERVAKGALSLADSALFLVFPDTSKDNLLTFIS
jgi:hypothetical protein